MYVAFHILLMCVPNPNLLIPRYLIASTAW
jgi:hypothetical protein